MVFEAERECGRPCPLRLSETGKTSFFLSSCDGRCYDPSNLLVCFIRSLRVATLSSSRFFPLVLGCGQQTSSWTLLSMAEPQRQAALQVILEFNTHTHRNTYSCIVCFYIPSAVSISIIIHVNIFVLSGGRDSQWRHRLSWTLVLLLSMRARWVMFVYWKYSIYFLLVYILRIFFKFRKHLFLTSICLIKEIFFFCSRLRHSCWRTLRLQWFL